MKISVGYGLAVKQDQYGKIHSKHQFEKIGWITSRRWHSIKTLDIRPDPSTFQQSLNRNAPVRSRGSIRTYGNSQKNKTAIEKPSARLLLIEQVPTGFGMVLMIMPLFFCF
jgi:hypothetical protein